MTISSPALKGDYAAALTGFLGQLGADRIAHSNRTLLDHLVGTCALLERWGCPESVCKAGLFHSIYGTSFFRDAPLTYGDRAVVLEQLGDEAERLAWLFCALDRGEFYRVFEAGPPFWLHLLFDQGEGEVEWRDLQGLAAILWANALEQAPSMPADPQMRDRERQALKRVFARDLLTDAARADLARAYGLAVGGAEAAPPRSKLAALLALEDASGFLADYFPERFYQVHAPVSRLQEFLYEDVRQLLELRRNHARAFFRTVDGGSSSLTPTPQQILPLYEAGFTIYLHGLRSPRFDDWTREVNEELGLVKGMTRVSAFASRKGLGLHWHYDLNDNIVIQARGTKLWQVAVNHHVRWPSAGYTLGHRPSALNMVEAPSGFPGDVTDFETVEARPGTVLFMPRGMWHRTETTEADSLHFNIQTGLPTWKDLASYFLQDRAPVGDVDMREGLTHVFEGGKLKREVRRELLARLRERVDALTEDDLDITEAELEGYLMRSRGANV